MAYTIKDESCGERFEITIGVKTEEQRSKSTVVRRFVAWHPVIQTTSDHNSQGRDSDFPAMPSEMPVPRQPPPRD